MITKSVSSGQRSATATISEETKFVFSDPWQFYHIKNLGTGNIYVYMSAGASADGDGVIPILPGEAVCTMHYYPTNAVYVTADNVADKVIVLGSNIATSPFKSAGGGGGLVTWNSISGKPTFAIVAESGAYEDLSGTPNLSAYAGVDHVQAANKGGTGQTAYTIGDILYANSASTLAKLSAGAAGTVLKSGGTGVAPAWGDTSGGSETNTTLFNGNVAASTDFTLTSAYTNFRRLIFIITNASTFNYIAQGTLETASISVGTNWYAVLNNSSGNTTASLLQMRFTSTTKIMPGTNCTLKVIGVS